MEVRNFSGKIAINWLSAYGAIANQINGRRGARQVGDIGVFERVPAFENPAKTPVEAFLHDKGAGNSVDEFIIINYARWIRSGQPPKTVVIAQMAVRCDSGTLPDQQISVRLSE